MTESEAMVLVRNIRERLSEERRQATLEEWEKRVHRNAEIAEKRIEEIRTKKQQHAVVQ